MEDIKPQNTKVTVLGLGSSGLKTVSKMSTMPASSWLQLLAVDTDQAALDACPLQCKIGAGFDWTDGQGCGGDINKGISTISRERPRINEFIAGSSLLIVTGGLGGGTGTGGAGIIASIAKGEKIPTIFIMTTPFAFEGHTKRKIAADGLRELVQSVDIMLCLPNDLLYNSLPADTPAYEAFSKADMEVARAVLGVSEIMRCKNLVSTDFADFRTILNKNKSTCSIGIGKASTADGLNRCHLALERMLDSPFLGGIEQLKSANALFVSLTGGNDLNLGEIKKTLDAVEKFIGKNTRIIIGTNTDPAYQDYIQLTAVAVHLERIEASPPESLPPVFSPKKDKAQPQKDLIPDEAEQLVLPLQNISRGIFTKTTPTQYHHEDLDIPTFQRKNVIIDQGKIR